MYVQVIARDYLHGDPHEDFIKFVKQYLQSDGPNGYYRIAENVQEPGQDLAGALKRFHEKHDILSLHEKTFRCDPQGFNTMCHGDTWFNNMLFK
jgi:thiamine kinase-like enzyme